jgi:hypothetical protein
VVRAARARRSKRRLAWVTGSEAGRVRRAPRGGIARATEARRRRSGRSAGAGGLFVARKVSLTRRC